jgi:hypothetical protein
MSLQEILIETERLTQDEKLELLAHVAEALRGKAEKPKHPSIPASQLLELSGIVSLGGNAVEDAERLYE